MGSEMCIRDRPRCARARRLAACRRNRPTSEFYPSGSGRRSAGSTSSTSGFHAEKMPNQLCHKQPLRLLLVGQGIDEGRVTTSDKFLNFFLETCSTSARTWKHARALPSAGRVWAPECATRARAAAVHCARGLRTQAPRRRRSPSRRLPPPSPRFRMLSQVEAGVDSLEARGPQVGFTRRRCPTTCVTSSLCDSSLSDKESTKVE